MGRVPVVVTFPPRVTADLVERLTAVSPDIDVVVTPYEEDSRLRSARGQGELDDARRAMVPAVSDELAAALGAAEVILGFDLPMGLVDRAPSLKWVQGIGAGFDHLWGTGLGSSAVRVTTAAGVAAVPIAEFVMARLLAVWKRLDELAEQQRHHVWKAAYGSTVAGRTLGVVGLGAIGTAVAERAHAFGMHVLGVRQNPSAPSTPAADEVHGPDRLLDLLPRCDAVVVCAPATPDTAKLIDAGALAAMRPDAVLCNVARGALVDEPALIDALQRGHLAAAILDVTTEEPLPADDPWWDAPRVHLSPHSSASIERYMERLFDLFADNLGRYVQGEPLRNPVSLPASY